jgi:serine O-acetyltransferase
MMKYFKEDIKRYFTQAEVKKGITGWKMAKKVVRNQALWMIFIYRYGRWLHTQCSVPVVKPVLKMLYALVSTPLEILLGINIHLGADIGKGFYIGHYGGIWIGPVKMGEYCNISQSVTIGIGGRGECRGLPEIGSRVYFAAGAKVFGKIKIGNNVAIGANAVVSKSLPDNAVAVGNPARIVSHEGSEGFIEIE